MFREVEQLIQGHTAYKCLCDSKDHDLSIEMRSRVYELVNSKKKKKIIKNSWRDRQDVYFSGLNRSFQSLKFSEMLCFLEDHTQMQFAKKLRKCLWRCYLQVFRIPLCPPERSEQTKCWHCPQVRSSKHWDNPEFVQGTGDSRAVGKCDPRRSEDIDCARLDPN